jgi:transcriptional regulator with GAF, ATPase, and Fis domain
VPVNAAAIPENLLEAELFGYKKGAFTGASENKIGLIEAANQGALFLDEIADLPLNLQAKLLRVLQENEVRRLGEVNTFKVDFRLICATNKDLKKLILQNEFRGDLYFRIQDLTIDVPPLVDRTGDIPLLVQHFLEKYKFPVKEKSELQRITRYLQSLTYIGNIRELESTVKRLITYYPDFEIETGINDLTSSASVATNAYAAGAGLIAARENLERTMIYNALRENDWSRNKAAQSLKISRQYIGILIKKYNIKE